MISLVRPSRTVPVSFSFSGREAVSVDSMLTASRGVLTAQVQNTKSSLAPCASQVLHFTSISPATMEGSTVRSEESGSRCFGQRDGGTWWLEGLGRRWEGDLLHPADPAALQQLPSKSYVIYVSGHGVGRALQDFKSRFLLKEVIFRGVAGLWRMECRRALHWLLKPPQCGYIWSVWGRRLFEGIWRGITIFSGCSLIFLAGDTFGRTRD